jgi:hypothetical protein
MFDQLQWGPNGQLLIINAAGKKVFDSSDQRVHTIQRVSKTAILPRVASVPIGSTGDPPATDVDLDLGPVHPEAVGIDGVFRIADAEGLALGERRFMGEENHNKRSTRRFLYAPRLQQNPNDWFPVGRASLLDMYMFLSSVDINTIQTSTSTVPEVGRLWHTIQFVIEGGRLKLLRRGLNITHRYTYLTIGSGINNTYEYDYALDCAALTIDCRLALSAVT